MCLGMFSKWAWVQSQDRRILALLHWYRTVRVRSPDEIHSPLYGHAPNRRLNVSLCEMFCSRSHVLPWQLNSLHPRRHVDKVMLSELQTGDVLLSKEPILSSILT